MTAPCSEFDQQAKEGQAWPARRRRLTLWLLIAGAVLIRGVYYYQASQGPCLWMHRWQESDMNFFHVWAKVIASGDWLTNRTLYPNHNWYRDTAREYLREHPEKLAALQADADAEGFTVEQAVWKRWYGGKKFHQDPLYPYLLALSYVALGEDHRWMFALQMVTGVGIVVLLYFLSRRLFGDAVGALAGVFGLACGPLVFYDLVLVRETFLAGAGLGLTLLTVWVSDRNKLGLWFLWGLAFAAASLLKNVFVPLWLAALVCLSWKYRHGLRAWTVAVAASALGLVLGVAPLAARNLAVGIAPLGLAGAGGPTVIGTNAADIIPDQFFASPMSQYLPHLMGRTEGALWPALCETLQTHESVLSVLRMFYGKFWVLWNWFEIPENASLYFFELYAPVLRFLPITMYVLAPLGLMGLVLGLPRLNRAWPLYLFVFAFVMMLLVFFPVSRWRLPLQAAMIPFAALTVMRLYHWLSTGSLARAGAVAFAIAGLFIWATLPTNRPLYRVADFGAAFIVYYGPLLEKAQAEGDVAEARRLFQDMVDHEPADLRRLGIDRLPQHPEESRLAEYFARVHFDYARLLRSQGLDRLAAENELQSTRLLQAARP